MTLITTFFLVLSVVFVSGQFLPTNPAKNNEVIEEELVLWRDRDRQQRQEDSPQETKSKVLDFSADNDQQPDNNGEFTSATLEAGSLTDSFTICSAFMNEGWIAQSSSSYMFMLLTDDGRRWGHIILAALPAYTQYLVSLGTIRFQPTSSAM